MKLLVTGGAGFIGAHFINYVLARGLDEVICVDALTYAGDRARLAQAETTGRMKFIHGNICDGDLVADVFEREKPDAVVNFAAETHVDRSIGDPALFLETNVRGTGVLLDACRRYGIGRFHQVSTDEVYGDLPLDGGEPFRETAPLRPSSPYAASKAAADLLTLSYSRTYGLSVTVSRCSNNYGPGQFPEKLIPVAISCLFRGEPVPLYGDGRHVRDWIYVKDHCAAVYRILREGREGQIYNIGGGAEVSNRDMVRRVAALLGRTGRLFRAAADRPGHDRRYALHTEKIKKELHWEPAVALDEGLAETVRFYAAFFGEREVQYDL